MSEQLTLFAVDSPASHGATPGSSEALKMTATSGQRCSELSRISGLDGSLARMSEALFQIPWASTAVYLTWKPSATPAGRLLFQLAVSAPRTDGTGVGLLPTVRATDADRGGRGDLIQAVRGNENKHYRMWPTPTAITDNGGAALCKWGGSGSREKLRQMVPPEELNGSLNPTWVEWLMGFPSGWTDLKP